MKETREVDQLWWRAKRDFILMITDFLESSLIPPFLQRCLLSNTEFFCINLAKKLIGKLNEESWYLSSELTFLMALREV